MTSDFLDRLQINFIKMLKKALEYHFFNFQIAERDGSPSATVSWPSLAEADRIKHFKALDALKFEAQAYICQAGRLFHFLKSMERYGINEPTDPELKEVWNNIYESGAVYVLRNKWAAHRSYDDPKEGDTEFLHQEVLLNLDQSVTMWQGDHNEIHLGKINFHICDFHPKMERFLDWLSKEVEARLPEHIKTAQP